MKFYRVTIYDFGTYGPRGLTIAATGLSTWANTDKAEATRYYRAALAKAIKDNRKAKLKLQIIKTPDRMTTKTWAQAIVNDVLPYEILETIQKDETHTRNLSLEAAS